MTSRTKIKRRIRAILRSGVALLARREGLDYSFGESHHSNGSWSLTFYFHPLPDSPSEQGA